MSFMYMFSIHPRIHKKPVNADGKPVFLEEVYKYPSPYKQEMYRRCRQLYYEVSGDNFHLYDYDCHEFVVEFNFVNPDNGRPMVAQITQKYNYAFYSD